MHPHPDVIADCVLQAFRALPTKVKPRKLADGRREWVPLAGIVLSKERSCGNDSTGVDLPNAEELRVTCAALATGMKCLAQSKVLLAKGNVLHDSHAEILAIRAFNRFLVDECAELARSGFGSHSQWVRWRRRGHHDSALEKQRKVVNNASTEGQQPFELHDDIGIHMYCSECPCGDASMELIMDSQTDSSPWTESKQLDDDLMGRGHFDRLGVVRRKPARADAPVTLSKSCSDKLALKQVTSLLSTTVSKLVWPGNAYLTSVILPHEQITMAAVERAWKKTGRLRPLTEISPGMATTWKEAGYSFHPFSVQGTTRTFECSKPIAGEAEKDKAVPSNLSAISTPHITEVLINGVLQGRRQFDPLGASAVSRRKIWSAVLEVAQSARDTAQGAGEDVAVARTRSVIKELDAGSYADVKGASNVRDRVKRVVQEIALQGWKKNDGDGDWCLEETDLSSPE